jgi:hypothetical protein
VKEQEQVSPGAKLTGCAGIGRAGHELGWWEMKLVAAWNWAIKDPHWDFGDTGTMVTREAGFWKPESLTNPG